MAGEILARGEAYIALNLDEFDREVERAKEETRRLAEDAGRDTKRMGVEVSQNLGGVGQTVQDKVIAPIDRGNQAIKTSGEQAVTSQRAVQAEVGRSATEVARLNKQRVELEDARGKALERVRGLQKRADQEERDSQADLLRGTDRFVEARKRQLEVEERRKMVFGPLTEEESKWTEAQLARMNRVLAKDIEAAAAARDRIGSTRAEANVIRQLTDEQMAYTKEVDKSIEILSRRNQMLEAAQAFVFRAERTDGVDPARIAVARESLERLTAGVNAARARLVNAEDQLDLFNDFSGNWVRGLSRGSERAAIAMKEAMAALSSEGTNFEGFSDFTVRQVSAALEKGLQRARHAIDAKALDLIGQMEAEPLDVLRGIAPGMTPGQEGGPVGGRSPERHPAQSMLPGMDTLYHLEQAARMTGIQYDPRLGYSFQQPQVEQKPRTELQLEPGVNDRIAGIRAPVAPPNEAELVVRRVEAEAIRGWAKTAAANSHLTVQELSALKHATLEEARARAINLFTKSNPGKIVQMVGRYGGLSKNESAHYDSALAGAAGAAQGVGSALEAKAIKDQRPEGDPHRTATGATGIVSDHVRLHPDTVLELGHVIERSMDASLGRHLAALCACIAGDQGKTVLSSVATAQEQRTQQALAEALAADTAANKSREQNFIRYGPNIQVAQGPERRYQSYVTHDGERQLAGESQDLKYALAQARALERELGLAVEEQVAFTIPKAKKGGGLRVEFDEETWAKLRHAVAGSLEQPLPSIRYSQPEGTPGRLGSVLFKRDEHAEAVFTELKRIGATEGKTYDSLSTYLRQNAPASVADALVKATEEAARIRPMTTNMARIGLNPQTAPLDALHEQLEREDLTQRQRDRIAREILTRPISPSVREAQIRQEEHRLTTEKIMGQSTWDFHVAESEKQGAPPGTWAIRRHDRQGQLHTTFETLRQAAERLVDQQVNYEISVLAEKPLPRVLTEKPHYHSSSVPPSTILREGLMPHYQGEPGVGALYFSPHEQKALNFSDLGASYIYRTRGPLDLEDLGNRRYGGPPGLDAGQKVTFNNASVHADQLEIVPKTRVTMSRAMWEYMRDEVGGGLSRARFSGNDARVVMRPRDVDKLTPLFERDWHHMGEEVKKWAQGLMEWNRELKAHMPHTSPIPIPSGMPDYVIKQLEKAEAERLAQRPTAENMAAPRRVPSYEQQEKELVAQLRREERQITGLIARKAAGERILPHERRIGEGDKVRYIKNEELDAIAAQRANTDALDKNTAAQVAAGGGGKRGGAISNFLGSFAGGEGDGGGGRNLMWGKGMRLPLGFGLGLGAGLPAAGTVGSFAGFGLEHLLMTVGGVVGSGVSALGGAGVMGAGALGQAAVGSGLNAAVMKSTLADTKQLGAAQTQVNKAVELYGVNSKQAAVARRELLSVEKELAAGSSGQGVKAEKRLAEQNAAVNRQFDRETQAARVQAAMIFGQIDKIAQFYMPRVGKYTHENLLTVRQGLEPLFKWLKGPEGTGVFDTLMSRFQENLPTAIHALDMGVEFMLKTIKEASQYTGGFTKRIDEFLTRVNTPTGFAKWSSEMRHLVDITRDWGHFLKLAGQDLVLLFRNDSETGRGVINTLSGMLEKVREYEQSSEGKNKLKTIFSVHKEEVIALLHAFAPLASAFSSIYVTAAPPMVKAVTGIAEAITSLLEAVNSLGPAMRDLVGLFLVGLKIGGVKSTFQLLGAAIGKTGLAAELGFATKKTKELAAAQDEGTLAADKHAAAEMGDAGADQIDAGAAAQDTAASAELGAVQAGAGVGAGTGLAGKLLKGRGAGLGAALGPGGLTKAGLKSTALKAGGIGLAGVIGTQVIGSIAGVPERTSSAISGVVGGGLTGAEIGSAIAPGIGTAVGAALGAGIGGALSGAFNLFSHKMPDYGKKYGQEFVQPFASVLTARTAQQDEARFKKQYDAANQAKKEHQQVVQELEQIRESAKRGIFTPAVAKEMEKNALKKFQTTFQNQFTSELRYGLGVAETMKEAFSSVGHKTSGALIVTTLENLKKLPEGARRSAAEAMLAYAGELERHKELPKGAVHKMLIALEREFPGFEHYLKERGEASARSFQSGLAKEEAIKGFLAQLKEMKAQYGLFGQGMEVTSKNWVSGASSALKFWSKVAEHETGKGKEEALKHVQELKDKSGGIFRDMLHETGIHMKNFKTLLAGGFSKAPELAEGELKRFDEAVNLGLAAGVLTAQEAYKLIHEAAAAYAKAFEAPPPKEVHLHTTAALTKGLPRSASAPNAKAETAFEGNQGSTVLKAGGGLVQVGHRGARGHDNIPLSVGGHDIIVGAGEQIAVLNAHQQAFLDDRLADMGGMEGMFSKINTPHYMAKGGYTGYSLPLPRAAMHAGPWSIDQGVDIPAGAGTPEFAIGPGVIISEGISGFGPNAPVLKITAGPWAGRNVYYGHAGPDTVKTGQHVAAGQQITEVGAGIVGISTGPHIEIGFGPPFGRGDGMAQGLRELLGGAGVSGAPGGGGKASPASFHIKEPKVDGGTGSFARAIQSSIHHARKGAEHYLEKHAPQGTLGPGSEGRPGGKTSAGGKYDRAALERLWIQYGGKPSAAHLAAAVALAESSGDPNNVNVNRDGSIDRGLWQINSVHGAQSTFNIPANVKAAISISKNGTDWIPWSTYNERKYLQFMAMGGMMGLGHHHGGMVKMAAGGMLRAGRGASPKATAAAKKNAERKTKYPRHRTPGHGTGSRIHHPGTTKPAKLQKLRATLSEIPGFKKIANKFAEIEKRNTQIADEETLLGNMDSNPATILPNDWQYLAGTILPGEGGIEPGVLVPHAEHINAEWAYQHHFKQNPSKEEREQEAMLTDQQALLSWLGALDDHRLIGKDDEPLLAKKGFLHFKAGAGVFASQKKVLEHHEAYEKKLQDQEIRESHRAAEFISMKKRRIQALHKAAQKAEERYKFLRKEIERGRLNADQAKESKENAEAHAEQHRAAINEAIASEQNAPETEQNPKLISALKAQSSKITREIADMKGASKWPVLQQKLKMQIHPVEETLDKISGASTKVGKGGEIGELEKQVKKLEQATQTITEAYENTTYLTLPEIKKKINSLQTGESPVPPSRTIVEEEGPEASSDQRKEEENRLLREQLQQSKLETAVSQAQYAVFSQSIKGLPPFGGHFAQGGIIPGAVGSPKMVIAHGGETVSKAGVKQSIKVVVEDGAVNSEKISVLIDGKVQQAQRDIGRAAFRVLPSRGGGQLG